MKKVIVTGAGGFIGHHLVKRLKQESNFVVGVDIKKPTFEKSLADYFEVADLRSEDECERIFRTWDHPYDVYHLAADMGGIGYIGVDRFNVATNNALMDTNMLRASVDAGVQRFFFSSSACIYPVWLQKSGDINLREDLAWPADPEPGYGMEKLFMEELCTYAAGQHGMQTRVARFHNVYGPLGTFEGGKEKAPAAMCRKIAVAKDGDTVEIWGDGKQRRSYTYIEDCIEGIRRLMDSTYVQPLNIGSDEAITLDELVDKISWVAGKKLTKKYLADMPQGVGSRNSDNSKIKEVLDWAPSTPIAVGVGLTYAWIMAQILKESMSAYA